MYIPKSFAESDAATLYQFMRDNNFATLITHYERQLTASHLPFLIDAERGVLTAHVARANPQWKGFDGTEALVIFQGPHAYISPTWYEPQPSVPTWNYTAAHVYGTPSIVDDPTAVRRVLRDLVANHERGRQPEWTMDLPEAYLQTMMQAIVVFELGIGRLEGKFKLSQNRSDADQKSVITNLATSSHFLDRETAHLMVRQRAKAK